MTDRREQLYRRQLRWYPRAWRETHGDVLLGILLDDAEAHGRLEPSIGERFAAARDGIGARLTTSLALGSALTGLALAALGNIVMVWTPALLTVGYVHWITSVLALLALVALARERTLLSESRSLVVLALGAPAFALGALALNGWGQAFDAADEGVATTGLGAGWPFLLVAGWVLGSAVCVLLLDALLERTRLHRAAAVAASLPLGVLLATSAAPLLITPLVPALVSAAAAGLALAMLRPAAASRVVVSAPPVTAPAVTAPTVSAERGDQAQRARVSPGTRRVARVLAVVTGFGSSIGIVYSFTGANWSSAAPDATIAMGQGISIALLSAVPLLAAVGMLAAARSRIAPQHTWGPLALIAVNFAAVTVGYLSGPDWNASAPGFATGAVFTGAAIAWWMTPRQRGPRHLRIALSALTGLAYAGILGLVVAPMLAFVAPIGAIALAAWPPGQRAPARRSSALVDS